MFTAAGTAFFRVRPAPVQEVERGGVETPQEEDVWAEETYTYSIRVPVGLGEVVESELPEEVHIYLPPVTRRRGRRPRPGLPEEFWG